jgi:stearoyl-CoA desaturase (delta-9 desaturase)
VLVLFLHQWLWPAVFLVPFAPGLVAPCVLLGLLLVLGVEVGNHRYFSHRSFTTGRGFQFVLAWWATLAFQRSVLWWACMHRKHHRHSDQLGDPHSPYASAGGSFWHAYINWGVAAPNAETDARVVRDLMAYPELRMLAHLSYLPNLVYAGAAFAVGHLGWLGSSGAQTVVWLYVLPVFLCQQIISTQATVAHGVPRLPGSYQPYQAGDNSLNHLVLGLVSCGGGFHNNHHRFPGSARLGLRWYELDLAYVAIRTLQRIGLVQKVSIPPKALRECTNWHGGKV